MPSNEEWANSGNSLFGKCGILKSKVKKKDLFHVCNVKDVLTCLSPRPVFLQCAVHILDSCKSLWTRATTQAETNLWYTQ